MSVNWSGVSLKVGRREFDFGIVDLYTDETAEVLGEAVVAILKAERLGDPNKESTK